MNYGISILFRAIPLVMALFCFGYGAFIYGYGDAGGRVVAGPVVFSLGMICIALFCTAATIIRQIIHLITEPQNMDCRSLVIWQLLRQSSQEYASSVELILLQHSLPVM